MRFSSRGEKGWYVWISGLKDVAKRRKKCMNYAVETLLRKLCHKKARMITFHWLFIKYLNCNTSRIILFKMFPIECESVNPEQNISVRRFKECTLEFLFSLLCYILFEGRVVKFIHFYPRMISHRGKTDLKY